jgi:hypothetical protein
MPEIVAPVTDPAGVEADGETGVPDEPLFLQAAVEATNASMTTVTENLRIPCLHGVEFTLGRFVR